MGPQPALNQKAPLQPLDTLSFRRRAKAAAAPRICTVKEGFDVAPSPLMYAHYAELVRSFSL